MRTRFISAAIAASLAAAGSAAAAPPAMSLTEAIRYARLHQPTLAAARARAAAARAQSDVPRAQLAPVITIAAEALVGTANNTTASYGTLPLLDVTRVGGTPANAPVSWSPEPSTIAGVAIHKELYDFGRSEAQAAAADELARAAAEDASAQDLDLTLLVSDSFYAVESAKQVEAASAAAVSRAREHHDFAQARVGAQLRPPIDVTRADADLARFEVDELRAVGAVTIAQAVLAAAIGAPDPAIDAGADDLTYAEPPALAGVGTTAAVADRVPELRAAHARLSAQQAETESIRDERRPDLQISAELTGRAGGTAVETNATPTGAGWIPDVPNWDALVVLQWPLFDRVVDARARTSQRMEAVRAAEVNEVVQQLDAALIRAYTELDTARSALPALQRALDAATANQTQADARFTAGLGNAVELSDAEALLVSAQIQLAIGQFELSRARARVQRALAEATP